MELPQEVAHKRSVVLSRTTKETEIQLTLNLDGEGNAKIATGVGFFDHMLEQIAQHGNFDVEIQCVGDLHIDAHHSVEDVGILLGQAIAHTIGDKQGMVRYGHAYVPLDEALSRVVIDLSGRSCMVFDVPFSTERVGMFDVELVREFFFACTNNAKMALHIHKIEGMNTHHIIESIFKAFGRALAQAVSYDPRRLGKVPSSKGVL